MKSIKEIKQDVTKWSKKTINKGVEKANKVIEWSKQNPEAAVTALITVGSIGARLFVPSEKQREERRAESRFYDPSTGQHWKLKRPMNGKENRIFEQRRLNGDLTGDILKDLKLLK